MELELNLDPLYFTLTMETSFNACAKSCSGGEALIYRITLVIALSNLCDRLQT